MPPSKGASSSGRGPVTLLLVLIGGFLAFCGLGWDQTLVIALGVVVAVGGPVMLAVLNSRNRVRLYVQGTAVVDDVTPRPSAEARTARGRLKLTITATGIRGVSVSGVDNNIPTDKWPEPGAVLPVQVLKGTPRKFTVLWDRVKTHQEAVREEQEHEPVHDDVHASIDGYSLDGDDYGPPGLGVPPDETPTLTNLPPIDAGIDEPVDVSPNAPRSAAPTEQIPDAARRPAGRPRHAASDPAHHATEPLGAGAATAVAYAASSEQAPPDAPEDDPADEAEAVLESAAGQTVIGDEDAPIIMRLHSQPRPSPHRRPSPHPRTGSHDRVRRGRTGRSRPEPSAPATPEEYTIPEAGSLPTPPPDMEWWEPSTGELAVPPPGFYPESERPEPEVIEGELVAAPAAAEEPEAAAPAEIEEAEIVAEPERPSGSAWAKNGRGPAPVGVGLYSAPPLHRPASPPEDSDEPVTPDPYATEHYLPPEDQLEEQPLADGAVAEFLATAPRRQTMPLDGVNGVSITLIVSDLQRSRRFYRDTLGLAELDSGPTSAVLESGSARVVLRRVADMPPVDRRVVHLNLDVPDVYEAYERLREQGVDFVHRPRVVPQGEQLELCSATFRDPDGHAIALTRWELRR